MDERTGPSAAFAINLSANLLTAMVVQGVISKAAAAALVDDTLNHILPQYPDHEGPFREIAATLTAQVQLVAMDVERKLGKEG